MCNLSSAVIVIFQILIQSVFETVVPKLVAEDIPLLNSLLADVFPGIKYVGAEMSALKEEIQKVCSEMHLTFGVGEDEGSTWVDKVWSNELYIQTDNFWMCLLGTS